MSVEIAWKQNILVTDFQLLKSLPVVLGFGSQTFICGFSRQNICSVVSSQKMNEMLGKILPYETRTEFYLIFRLFFGQ